jgi:hydrogenase expression/formation protein HypC
MSIPGRDKDAPDIVEQPAHCADDVCITCSDMAVPVRIISLHGYELATVRTEAGTHEEISVALVDAVVGDVVLVHAKEAIARVDVPSEQP